MAPETQTARCPKCGKSFAATVRMCPDDGTVLEHETTAASQIGKVLDGKYRLDGFLSQGGMGAVYKATHVMLGKTVAVKLINPELVTSPEVVRRFQREARAATALNHPNIVAVYDLGQTPEGTLYIAMEFVDGPSLKSVIVSGGPMPPHRTITILRQVASALSVAHRNKIVHRDLKPHNIMLAHGPERQETVKLVDFGIAKTFEEGTQLTMAGDTMGTPHYMAPEQAEGRPVDARSDLYSLGVIVYEMLTGEVPFNDASTPAILVKHLKELPERPSLRNPRVAISPALEAIALKCLEKDPANRYQTAEEFSAALEQAAIGLGAASAMQTDATVPMAAVSVPAGSGAASDAATVPIPAAAVASAPTAKVEHPVQAAMPVPPKPAPAKPASDTRPTVMTGAAIAAAQTPPKKSSNAGLVIGFVLLAVVLGAVGMYMNRSNVPPPEQTAAAIDTPAPSTTPAAAPQDQPDARTDQPPAPPIQSAVPSEPAPPGVPPSGATPSATPAAAPAVATSSPAAARAGTAAASVPAPARSSSSSLSASSAVKPAPAAGAPTVSAAAGSGSTKPVPAPVLVAGAAPAAAGGAAPGGAVQAAEPPRAQAAAFPENPAVFFQCSGAPDICSPLRAAVADALDKAGFSSVRAGARADIEVDADAQVVQGTVSQQFGTTFAVRNYSIELSGEAPRTSEAVSMPPPASLSFDAQFGSERAAEKARALASDIVDRIKAFVRKKRG